VANIFFSKFSMLALLGLCTLSCALGTLSLDESSSVSVSLAKTNRSSVYTESTESWGESTDTNFFLGEVILESSDFVYQRVLVEDELEDPLSVRYPFWIKYPAMDKPWLILKDNYFLTGVSELGISPQPTTLYSEYPNMAIIIRGQSEEGFLKCEEKWTIQDAVKKGIQMIQILQQLYSVGVIHGAVRVENFLHAEEDRLLIANFEHAKMAGGNSTMRWSASPWRAFSGGDGRSFRDDLFGALMSIAALMNGPEYIEIMGNRMRQGHDWRSRILWSPNPSIFWIDEITNPLDLETIGNATRAEITGSFMSIQRTVNRLGPMTDMNPIYVAIIGKLQYIANLLE